MKVITTVGISILTQNYQGQFPNSKDALLSDWANERIQPEIERFRNQDNQSNQLFPKTDQEVCAEIHTLYEIAKEKPTETLQVYLLATDTVTAVLACELIIAWLNFKKEDGDETAKRIQIAAAVNTGELDKMRQQRSIYQSAYPDAFILPIPDLQVNDPRQFQTTGFSNLLTAINAIAGKDNPLLNISGGYKATIPILTIMGQIYGYPLRYTHQDNKEGQIIGLEKLPVAFDYSIFEDNYLAFELLNPDRALYNLPTPEVFKDNLAEQADFESINNSGLIIEIETGSENTKRISLSALGKLLFAAYHNNIRSNDIDIGNLVGKVMELKVFQFFANKLPDKTILEKPIGISPQGDAYDADVWVENDQFILSIEVKPEKIKILRGADSIRYKCEQGAFKASVTYANERQRAIKCIVAMYHHRQPNRFQEAAFKELKQMNIPSCNHLAWLWVKPPENYKHNVNWKISEDKIKQYDFDTGQWKKFDLKTLTSF